MLSFQLTEVKWYGDIELGQFWGCGDVLLPDGTKPLSEPMLIYHQ